MGSQSLSDELAGTLVSLVNLIVPSNADRGLPAAADVGLGPGRCRRTRWPVCVAARGRLPQYLIAELAQQQAAGFLASDGTVIPDVNFWSRMWFGVDLFETPPETLPEDLNFPAP